ncbi:DUF6517 family protein [Halovenus rubra]|uniref:DUF6517 family protein n=2 Tax=Halovenus rubra TaxID=869890 RepID=A0ABD5X8D5_9EURY|nr:DUF6517 family protein [Halovenus rubra]
MKRRELLAGCGVGFVTATAGCLDSLPWSDETIDTSSPEAVVNSYITLQEQLYDDPEATKEKLDTVMSNDAVSQIGSSQNAQFLEKAELTITSIDGISTTTEGLTVRQIRELAQRGPQQKSQLESRTINDLGSRKTALVDAAYSRKIETEINGKSNTFENSAKERYLVVNEKESWQIVLRTPVLKQ